MEIRVVADKKIWNEFLLQNGEYSAFLNAWEWSEFQIAAGHRVMRYGFFQGEKLSGIATVIVKNIGMGFEYLWISRAPILEKEVEYSSEIIQKHFANFLAGAYPKAMCIRWEPLYPCVFSEMSARPALSLQPRHTLVLDLQAEEEAMLANMHPKTRYNIRLAEKKGVSVRFSREKKDIERFLELTETTARRDRFRAHPKVYYERMFETLSSDFLELVLAENEGKILAANALVRFGDTMTYLHGASSNEHRQVMAPHLLQWQSILRAREAGCRFYDFWGIAPAGSAKETAWSGVTRFKRGFGGKEIEYPETQDIILSPWKYRMYNVARKVRNFMR